MPLLLVVPHLLIYPKKAIWYQQSLKAMTRDETSKQSLSRKEKARHRVFTYIDFILTVVGIEHIRKSRPNQSDITQALRKEAKRLKGEKKSTLFLPSKKKK